MIKAAFAKGYHRFEWIHRKARGEDFPVEVSHTAITYRGKSLLHCLWRDLTEKKQAEEALRESEELYRSLFEHMLNGFAYCKMLFDQNRPQDCIYLSVNRAFETQTGLQNVVGKKISEVIPGIRESNPELLEIYGRVALTGKPERVEIYVEALKMWFSLSVYSPEKEYFVAVFDVITERKQAEEAMTLNASRVQALLDLHLLAQAPPEEILDFALEASLKVTQSEYCWVGLMDEAESVLSIHRWSKKVMKQCAITDKPILFPVTAGGLWGDCVRQKEAVLVNDYQAPHPGKKGLPKGHVPIRRFLAVPVLDGGRTVAVAAVANKGKDYTEDDVSAFTSLVQKMWELLRRKQTDEALKESLARTTEVQYGTIEALATVTAARDPYTAGHQRRVTQLACAVARELGLPADRVAGLRVMGLLHDLGKISIPAEILSKPGKLSDAEFGLIKSHAQAGYEIVKDIQFPWPVAEVILQHHERLDGSGYPQGLKDDEIIMEAKILAVADVVEAMASHRPYRPALGLDQALEEISRNRGVLYDPEVADACIKVCTENKFTFE
jgi:putative nucleotidyltransferase with HDIG domain/PAS domain S-box-containing protein